MATRWGIASAGKISFDFALAISTLPRTEHVVLAVAARALERAQSFATQLEIPTAYGSYEELAADPQIDVIYVGSINPEHLRMCKLFINSGKAVLCEKPMCMNRKETQELVDLAREKKIFLMEAIWSRFNPVYLKVKEEVQAGTIGDIQQLVVSFGVKLEHKDRVTRKELGGSVVLDIGVYTIQLATFLLGKPSAIQATGDVNKEGVDDSMHAMLSYPGGKVAILTANSRVNMVNEALIYGTKGTIRIAAPFWCPTECDILDRKFAIQVPVANKEFNHTNSILLRNEAMEVRTSLLAGRTESLELPLEASLDIADIEDEIRKQLGAAYEQ